MSECKLVMPGTGCIGAVTKRCLEGEYYAECCVRHYQIFRLLLELADAGIPLEELKNKSPDELAERLKELENEQTEKVLANEEFQETTE